MVQVSDMRRRLVLGHAGRRRGQELILVSAQVALLVPKLLLAHSRAGLRCSDSFVLCCAHRLVCLFLMLRLHRLGVDLAAGRSLPLVFSDLEFLDSFENLDSVQTHLDPEVILQVDFGDVFDYLSVNTDFLCNQPQVKQATRRTKWETFNLRHNTYRMFRNIGEVSGGL